MHLASTAYESLVVKGAEKEVAKARYAVYLAVKTVIWGVGMRLLGLTPMLVCLPGRRSQALMRHHRGHRRIQRIQSIECQCPMPCCRCFHWMCCSASGRASATARFRTALQRNDWRVPGTQAAVRRVARKRWRSRRGWLYCRNLNVVKTYGDGRMDIMTQGRQRFEVMQVHSERPFLQAEVFYLRDDPGVQRARKSREHWNCMVKS